MPNIARTKPRPMPVKSGGGAPKTKILLVRQPVKSVRKSDEPDRAMFQLAVGVVVVLGALGLLWVMGYLGFRLGYAELIRVRDLEIEGAGGLATAAIMLAAMPLAVLQAGIDQPMWMMLGFVMIAIPAATLGAVQAPTPGGPRPKPAVVALAITGAIAAMLNGVAVFAWTVPAVRQVVLTPSTSESAPLGDDVANQSPTAPSLPPEAELPFDPSFASQWFDRLLVAGGLDVLAAISAALWIVVVMRLTLAPWLRGLAASTAFLAFVIIFVALARSIGSAAHIDARRAVVYLDDGAMKHLVLGYTPQYIATLNVQEQTAFVELRNRPEALTVVGQQSVVRFLRSQTKVDE